MRSRISDQTALNTLTEHLLKFLQARYPNAGIEVWSMNEQTPEDSLTLRYRLGLHPILHRVWVPFGSQPIASVIQKYKCMWLCGFVHPESGETYWWIIPLLKFEFGITGSG
ncbi:MAG: hypothetical protein ACYTXI_35860 [Nostoc sp.]